MKKKHKLNLDQRGEVQGPVLSDNLAIQIVQSESKEQKENGGPRHYDLAMLYINDYVE